MTDWLLVHDEGAGLGHRQRLRALATSLEHRGIATAVGPIETPLRAPRVIIDSYRVRADDRDVVDAELTVAFDDLRRDLAVDVVIDPSPGAIECVHAAARRVLAGAQYAVVDPRVNDVTRCELTDAVTRVLVTFGAADRAGLAAETAAEIVRLLPGAAVSLPVGSWWDGAVPAGVHALHVADGLAPDLASSDLVVTAGGVTFLETLALGRPTVVVVTAENQRIAAEHVAASGAAVIATADAAAGEAVALANDPARRRALAARATELIDGRGADRVAAEIATIQAA